MSPEDFCYWLKGFMSEFEIGVTTPSKEQWSKITKKLKTVSTQSQSVDLSTPSVDLSTPSGPIKRGGVTEVEFFRRKSDWPAIPGSVFATSNEELPEQ